MWKRRPSYYFLPDRLLAEISARLATEARRRTSKSGACTQCSCPATNCVSLLAYVYEENVASIHKLFEQRFCTKGRGDPRCSPLMQQLRWKSWTPRSLRESLRCLGCCTPRRSSGHLAALAVPACQTHLSLSIFEFRRWSSNSSPAGLRSSSTRLSRCC